MIYGVTANRKIYGVEVWAQLLGNSNQQQQLHFASFLSDLLDFDVVPMETETNQHDMSPLSKRVYNSSVWMRGERVKMTFVLVGGAREVKDKVLLNKKEPK